LGGLLGLRVYKVVIEVSDGTVQDETFWRSHGGSVLLNSRVYILVGGMLRLRVGRGRV
jgi:hypothetical protein